ncbi:hypothetical protein QTP70_025334 [Hemibagrus guttatus]|uniref:Assembly chaperone of rpl4 n=1 Tax=Hemibagrus guttatus TaxID=175788 RepID=A0AAE0US28_9TELE|nr:hypothetical protein QTP70_025334 [Hemibagrus guttatus]
MTNSLTNTFYSILNKITVYNMLVKQRQSTYVAFKNDKKVATDVLEGLLEEDDEVVQVWYLLGWLYYLQADKPSAAEDSESLKKSARIYLTKAKKLYIKLQCDDAPMLEHTEQLLGELGGELVADDDADEAGPSVDDIGDDFIQSSEDEEDADDAMEH